MNRSLIISSALAGLITAGAVCGDVVTPLSATTSITGDAGSNVNYLLADNVGFAAPGLQDETLAAATIEAGDSIAKAAATFAELSSGGQAESWTNSTTAGNPVFVFDLGSDTAIGSAILWQYGNNGGGAGRVGNHTQEFELIFHTEAEGDTFDFATAGGTEAVEFGGTMQPAIAATTLANSAQLFFFGTQETARYVALRIASNWPPASHPEIVAGGDRYGLGEVRFATEAIHDPIISSADSIVLESDGSAETLMVDVVNNGASQTLNVSNAVVTGYDASAFTVTTDFTNPLVIGPAGLPDSIEIDFDPSVLTPGVSIEATLEITSDDVVRPTFRVPITGVVRDPWINTEPVIDLGIILPDAGTQNFTIDVNNLGSANNLTVSGAYITIGTEFTVEDDLNSTPLVVPPGGTGVINLSFDSGGLAGVFTDTLEIDSDDEDEPIRIVNLTVTVDRDPEISVLPVVDLGVLPFGVGPQAFSVQVDNIGEINDLLVSAAETFGGDADHFVVGSFDASIPAGGSGVINVTFDPTGFSGRFSTTLEITSNDTGVLFATDVELRAIVDPHAAPKPSPSGLVAWWSMDDDLDPGKDDSGNVFDGTPLGGTPVSTAGANANTGNALEFSGTTHIDVPWSGYLNPGSFTVTLWANPTNSAGSYAAPITSRDDVASPTSTHGYVLYNDFDGNWTFWTGDGDPGWHNTTNGGSVTVDTWTHLAISYDADSQTKSIFVNGSLADSATVPPNLYSPNGPETEDLHIGAGQDPGDGFYFQGALDDVAVFSTALSTSDITTIMNNGVAGFLGASPAPMELIADGYSDGNLILTINSIPVGETFHLRGSTDGQSFTPLPTPIDFDSTTAQPIQVPGSDPLLLVQAYSGPSDPPE